VLFGIMSILFVGYGIAFHLAFGQSVLSYRDFPDALFTLLRAALGDFELEPLRRENWYLGPLLFFSFIVLVLFVCISMFLAIVCEAFDAVRKRLLQRKQTENGSLVSREEDPLSQDIYACARYVSSKITQIRHCYRRQCCREPKVKTTTQSMRPIATEPKLGCSANASTHERVQGPVTQQGSGRTGTPNHTDGIGFVGSVGCSYIAKSSHNMHMPTIMPPTPVAGSAFPQKCESPMRLQSQCSWESCGEGSTI